MRSKTSSVSTHAGILRKPLPVGGLVEAIMGKDSEPLRESRGMRVCGDGLCCGAPARSSMLTLGRSISLRSAARRRPECPSQ